jgi:hypothetical protein
MRTANCAAPFERLFIGQSIGLVPPITAARQKWLTNTVC